MHVAGDHLDHFAHGLGLSLEAIEAGVEFEDCGALGVMVAPGVYDQNWATVG
jgi:hypothetical protein